MRECLKKRGRKIGNHATFEQRGSQPWPPSFPPVPPACPSPPSFYPPVILLSPVILSEEKNLTPRLTPLPQVPRSQVPPSKDAPRVPPLQSPFFVSPFLSPPGHSHVSLYVIPAKAGIQSLFPLRNALVPGAWPAGRPGPFLWIPAKNCRNDRGGNGGNACMSFPRKRESRVFSPSATRWCRGLGRPGVLGHSSGFPLKTAGMTGGETAGMLVCHSRESGNDRGETAGKTGWVAGGKDGVGGRRERRGGWPAGKTGWVAGGKDGVGGRRERRGGWPAGKTGWVAGGKDGVGGRRERRGGWPAGKTGWVAGGKDGAGGRREGRGRPAGRTGG